MVSEVRPTQFLDDVREGGREAIDRLVPLLYDELKEIAHRHLARGAPGSTLNTTALVNEAYLKLVDQDRASWNDRVHFLAIAALAMRQILIDRARAKRSLRHGGEMRRITLDDQAIAREDEADAVLQIADAIDHLALIDARLARVIDYRFFGGLSNREIATALGVTEKTVERDWIKARMLLREMLAA